MLKALFLKLFFLCKQTEVGCPPSKLPFPIEKWRCWRWCAAESNSQSLPLLPLSPRWLHHPTTHPAGGTEKRLLTAVCLPNMWIFWSQFALIASLPNVFVGTDFTGSSPWAFPVQLVCKISDDVLGSHRRINEKRRIFPNQYQFGKEIIEGKIKIKCRLILKWVCMFLKCNLVDW